MLVYQSAFYTLQRFRGRCLHQLFLNQICEQQGSSPISLSLSIKPSKLNAGLVKHLAVYPVTCLWRRSTFLTAVLNNAHATAAPTGNLSTGIQDPMGPLIPLSC